MQDWKMRDHNENFVFVGEVVIRYWYCCKSSRCSCNYMLLFFITAAQNHIHRLQL